MPGVINLTAPIVKFAHQKITLQELGKEVAEVLSLHIDFANQPRLQRISGKFATVEDMERFDAFMLDLAHWCDHDKCQLVLPGKK